MFTSTAHSRATVTPFTVGSIQVTRDKSQRWFPADHCHLARHQNVNICGEECGLSALRSLYCGDVGINLALHDMAHYQLLSPRLLSHSLISTHCPPSTLCCLLRFSLSSQARIVLIYINWCKVCVYYHGLHKISIFISKKIFHLFALLLGQGLFWYYSTHTFMTECFRQILKFIFFSHILNLNFDLSRHDKIVDANLELVV